MSINIKLSSVEKEMIQSILPKNNRTTRIDEAVAELIHKEYQKVCKKQ